MIILNLSEAQLVIDNCLQEIQTGYEAGSKVTKSGRVQSSGLESVFRNKINDAIYEYGVIPTGMALEQARKTVRFERAILYYPAKEGTYAQQIQEEASSYMDDQFENLINTALDILEGSDEELDEEGKESYRRERRRIQSKIYRAWKKGISIPSLPRLLGLPTKSDFFNLLNFESEWF